MIHTILYIFISLYYTILYIFYNISTCFYFRKEKNVNFKSEGIK